MSYKGKFVPKNPNKYIGDPTNIVFRSLWERKVMMYLDERSYIKAWSSEEIIIPYEDPTRNNSYHRYFPDFYVKAETKSGKIVEEIWEIKPHKQTVEPRKKKVGSRTTKKYIIEVINWGRNNAKWNAAEEFCMKKGWNFRKLTEYNLGIKKWPTKKVLINS